MYYDELRISSKWIKKQNVGSCFSIINVKYSVIINTMKL